MMTTVTTTMVVVTLFCLLDMLATDHKKTAPKPCKQGNWAPGFAQDHAIGKWQSQKRFHLYNNPHFIDEETVAESSTPPENLGCSPTPKTKLLTFRLPPHSTCHDLPAFHAGGEPRVLCLHDFGKAISFP